MKNDKNASHGPHTHSESSYDAAYYASHCGATPYSRDQAALMNHFRNFAATLVDRYAPKRVLDVGCAKGLLVEHLRDLGVDAQGVDTSDFALSEVREDVKPFCKFASALEPFDGRYDLITCIEVAEHLPEEDAEALIRNLCAHADEIVFSSTPLDYAEETHFNVQPREYWVELFARNGFYPDLRFEPHFVTPQALRFKRMTRPLNVVILSKEREEWAVVRLRILDPLRELEKHGRMNVTYVSAYDTKLPIEAMLAADVFVVQREFAERATSEHFRAVARQLGKVLVFEIDDLLTKVPRSNPVHPYSMRIAQDLIDTAKDADFITASTTPLLEELGEEIPDADRKGHVLRNCVNTEIWGETFTPRTPQENAPYVVGWFGSPTHQEDLAIVKDAIAYLARKHPGEIEFHFFGYLPSELKGIEGVKLVRGQQPNVVKHAAGVRESHIDLAIAPLVDNPFNRSKSDLKWLEYSICGIPAVFSDVAPYRDAITHGVNGWIVKNDTASWVNAIEGLLRDDAMRMNMAQNAFETVRNHYCIDRAAERWDALYRSFVVTGSQHHHDEIDDAAGSLAVARLLLAQARFQANHSHFDGVGSSIESLLRFDSELAPRALALATAIAEQGAFAASIKAFSAIAATGDQVVASKAWLSLARIHETLGDTIALDRALEAGATADASNPDLALKHIDRMRATGREAAIPERLIGIIQKDHSANEALVIAESLIAAGRPKEALLVVRRASSRYPDADFAPLVVALTRASTVPEDAIGEWSPSRHRRQDALLRIAVFTREPMSGPRVRSRLAAPLQVLGHAAAIETEWSDGRTRLEIANEASVVVFQRSIVAAADFGALFERVRSGGSKIAYEIDDASFPGAEAALTRWLPHMDAILVPNRALKDALIGLAPASAEKIHVIATGVDVEMWPNRRPTRTRRRPHVALFTGYANPQDVRPLVRTLAKELEETIGRFDISHWSVFPNADSEVVTKKSVGCASPIYCEFAKQLVRQEVDIALVPVSNDDQFTTLPDRAWLDLAAARIPGLFSAREPFASSVLAGSTGFLLSDDPAQWVNGVVQLIQNPLLGRDIGNRAWTVAHAERTVPLLAKRLGRILHDIAHSPRTTSASAAR